MTCTGISLYLTLVVKVHSDASIWTHVTAVQSSGHFSLLTIQGFGSWGTNQQPATENPLRHTQLRQMCNAPVKL